MRYWIKFEGGPTLAGLQKGKGLRRYQFKSHGTRPLTAGEVVSAVKSEHWATSIVPAKEKD